MRQLRSMSLLLPLVLAAPAAAEDLWWQQVPDIYAGEIWSGDAMHPGQTQFTQTDDGRLVGSYSFLEDNGQRQRGTLDHCEPTGLRRLTCRWHDGYGSGLVKLQFSQGLDRFKGGWLQSGMAVRPWRGERIPRS
ncbi:MAG: hypothetical protein P4L82_17405 [Ancalomicrobiaceae bacterium]|nr:hypothetical protein [Ancalomicrobiaceae bacterium]